MAPFLGWLFCGTCQSKPYSSDMVKTLTFTHHVTFFGLSYDKQGMGKIC